MVTARPERQEPDIGQNKHRRRLIFMRHMHSFISHFLQSTFRNYISSIHTMSSIVMFSIDWPVLPLE